ncbi:hypothetical protein IWZ03DRAFT_438097 [Phyllosticta citriasiana]|uniref:Uncharacterized protein n=1 Tax=Phyllosticta citriasiana TaxID=595635 RepID=A0ABR1KSV7_9PEZI
MRLQLLSLLPGLAAGAAITTPIHQPDGLHNANHIFNAIHSSLRQWGSSLQHNGMSFFLASVPEGTQFYHGRRSNETVPGLDDRHPDVGHLEKALVVDLREHLPCISKADLGNMAASRRMMTITVNGTPPMPQTDNPPWESQIPKRQRARRRRRRRRRKRVTQVEGRVPDERGPRGGFGDITYYRAVAARFDGIGGNRVQLNYDDFVTAYTYGLDLFHGEQLPRLVNASNSILQTMRADVTVLVLSHAPPAVHKKLPAPTNWQNIADMVVERYSTRFPDLLSSRIDSLEKLQAEVKAIHRPYIDFGLRNSTAEVERCATPNLSREVLEAPEAAPLAAHAIRGVTTAICSSLLHASQAKTLEYARAGIRNLTEYLQWTTWKRCSGCNVNEVCFIPIWPIGRTQDYENPQCQSSLPNSRGDSYWRGFGPHGKEEEGHYPYPYPYPYGQEGRRENYEL